MKRVIFLAFLTLLCATACNKNRYIANVTDLQLVSVSPREGYEGSLVKVLGRNFSTSFGENEVTINGVKAKLIDFSKDQITIIAPENEYGTYPVVVSTPKGTISHESVTFTYKKRPDKLYMVTTVAGNGANALKDDIGASASVGGVEGLCFAPDGTLWFCQRNGGYAIRSFNPATNMVKTIASSPKLPWGGGFDSKGDFYYAGKADNKIFKLSGDTVSEYSSASILDNPMYVRFDSKDNMWIASRNNNTVYVEKAGNAIASYTDTDYFPTCLDIDSKDRVFFGSSKLHTIMMIDTDGSVRKVIGCGDAPNKESYSESLSNANPLEAQVGTLGGIAIGNDGCLYFTDISTFTVMKVEPGEDGNYDTGKISLLAGQPFSSSATNGTSDKASFKYPSGIAISDDCKRIYVAEPTAYVIRMIDLQ